MVRLVRLSLEPLEDRAVPAATITVQVGAAGSGSLDSFLGPNDGTISTADASGVDGTVSTGALAQVLPTVDISITAEDGITFNDFGGTLTLPTAAGHTALFVAQGTLGSTITFANTANTLATSGGDLVLSTPGNLTPAGLNAVGGIVVLAGNTVSLQQLITAAAVGVNAVTVTGSAPITATAGLSVTVTGPGSTLAAGALQAGTGGLFKGGAGTLTLNGPNPLFGDATNVNAGTLLVNGNLGNSPVRVQAGAVLGGTGTVGPTVVNGTISGGGTGAIGTLSVAGGTNALSLATGSTFQVEVNSLASFDRVSVTGSASLGGATLQMNFAGSPVVGDAFTILTTTAGVTGLFKNAQGNTLNDLDTFALGGRVYQIDYSATAVKVTMVAFVSQTTVTSSANPSPVGDPVTITATVGTPAAGAPPRTGTVTFFEGTTQLSPPVTLNAAGQATFTTSTFPVGTHAISVTYSGDANYQGSSGNISQVVSKRPSTTTLTSNLNPADYGVSYTFTASVRPAGTGPTASGNVTFVDTTTGITLGVRTLNSSGDALLTVNGSVVAYLNAGLHTVRASYTGDPTYAPSAGTFTQTVDQVGTGTGVVNDHPGGSVFGEPVIYTATVTSATVTPFGTVSFTADDGQGHVTPMGTKALDSNGKAALTFNALPVGTQTITVAFNANVDFQASGSTTSETVTQGTTSAANATSKSPTVFGEPVTFTATITANAPSTLPPPGSVTFTDTTTGTTLGTTSLASTGSPGQARAQLSVSSLSSAAGGKSHTIQATYNTNGNYATSSASITQVVNPAPTTTTVVGSSNPAVFQQPVTFTATVSAAPGVLAPTGTVVFKVDGVSQVPVTLNGSGQATLTQGLALGPHTIAADYTSSDVNSFLSSSSSTITEQVDAAPTTTALTPAGATVTLGQPATFTATVGATPSAVTPTGTASFGVDGTPVATVNLDGNGRATFTTSSLTLGSHTISATYSPANGNFLGSTASTTVTVDPAIVIAPTALPTGRVGVAYSQTITASGPTGPYTFTVTSGTPPAGLTLSTAGALTGTPTALGTATFTVSAINDTGSTGSRTYNLTINLGPPPPPPPGTVVAAPFLLGGPPDGSVRLLLPGGKFGAPLTALPGLGVVARTASADLTGDGVPDLVVGAGPGSVPRVVILDGKTSATIVAFSAFEDSFRGGVFVAAGDMDGDGRAEVVVTPDESGGPVVAVYRGSKLAAGVGGQDAQITRFFGIAGDPNFRGGCRPALGDLNGDGAADLVVSAGVLGGPRIAIFDGLSLKAASPDPGRLVGDFFAFEDTLRNGAFVAAGDVTGDGRADIAFGGGPGGAPRVRLFDGKALLSAPAFSNVDAIAGAAQKANFFAGDVNLRGSVRLALHDFDGNGAADLAAGSGAGEPSRVRVYTAATLLAGAAAPDVDLDPFGAVLANGVFVG